MCNINHSKFPCRICAKIVHDKDKAVQCDLSELWIYIKCNNLNYLHYRYHQNCDESWYSIAQNLAAKCFLSALSSNKNVLAYCTSTDSNITWRKDLENDHNSSLSLTRSNLELLVNQFNNATQENNNDPEKMSSCNY